MTEKPLWDLFWKTGLPECYTLHHHTRRSKAKPKTKSQPSQVEKPV